MFCQPTFPVASADRILKPTDHDVKCGRGNIVNSHPGNAFFRSLVSCNKELYVMSTDRIQKRQTALSIISAIHSLDPPGRFVEHSPATGLWTEVDEDMAIKKTCQALRNGSAALKKRLTAELDNPSLLTKALVATDTHAPGAAASKNPETHQRIEGLGDRKNMKRTNEAMEKEKKAAGLPKEEQLSALRDLDFLDTVFEKEAQAPMATEAPKQVCNKIPAALDLVGVDLFETAPPKDTHAPAVPMGGVKTGKQKTKPPTKKRQRTKRARALKIVKLPNNDPPHGVHSVAV